MTITGCIFWGATGQAKVLRECIQCSGTNLLALFDNNVDVKSPFEDVPLYYGELGFKDWISRQDVSSTIGFSVAIGGNNGTARIEIQNYLTMSGLVALTIIHPTAFIASDTTIGAGSQILAQSAICVDSRIGCACIINTGATVDHECRLGEGVHIAPGVHIAGCVSIGDYAFIGTGAIVLPRIKIGKKAIVGAGAVVIRDVPDYATVVGNPAKIINP